MEQKIRAALDADFKEYLGEYTLTFETQEDPTVISGKRFGVSISNGRFIAIVDDVNLLPKMAWRSVAEHWLKDETTGHGEPHKTHFCFYEGSVRGVQNKNLPWPHEKSDKEMDIRWRLAFGKEIQ